MEDTERPKPTRRRAAAAKGNELPPSGDTPATPTRRRAAAKPAEMPAAPAVRTRAAATTTEPRAAARARQPRTSTSAQTSPNLGSPSHEAATVGANVAAARPAPAAPPQAGNETSALRQATASDSRAGLPPQGKREQQAAAAPPPRPEARPESTPAPVPSFARKPAPTATAPATARPADTSTRSAQVLDWLLGYLPERHRSRAREYLVLMRMDRPVGALLLLWPTWWALWFAANDFPPPGLLLIFTLGVFVMRSAGCVINDYADHGWLDAHVERTRGRPMAAGRVSKKEALVLFGGLLAFAFALVLFTNALTIKLSFVGAALAALYPFTKRVTHLAQVVLGAAFGWAIPMAFAAVTNTLPPLAWLLFLANVLFSVIYDTQYAMVDRDDDLRVGAKSTAILFGDADRAILGVLMATFLLAMLLAGTRAHLHWPYFVGLAGAAALFGWQQWLIRDRARDACFAAFRNNNWVGLLLWVGLVLALAIR